MRRAALTLALLDRASGRFGLMVDSSKTAWGSLTAPFKQNLHKIYTQCTIIKANLHKWTHVDEPQIVMETERV